VSSRFGLPVILGFLLLAAGCTDSAQEAPESTASHSDSTLTRIAFGSCNDQAREQPLWAPIRETDPDLWLWLGDNIYADTENMRVMDSMYAAQKQKPGYRALRQETRILGTWDDHDYGANDAGRSYPKRDSSQQLFLDFFDVPDDDPRRQREGVYSAHTFGPPDRQVKIILLDTRYHRDPISRDPNSNQRYYPNATGDVLGETQWDWLERELRASEARITLVGTSIQAVSSQHPWEKWSNFPEARRRLFDVIERSGTPGVVLLSGDRHKGELSRHDEAIGYPLYDFTSSGLTHYVSPESEPNRHRVGDYVTALHFGLLTIDWDADPVTLALEIRGTDNESRFRHTIRLPELRASAS
jgi:alkaline phosphatase D